MTGWGGKAPGDATNGPVPRRPARAMVSCQDEDGTGGNAMTTGAIEITQRTPQPAAVIRGHVPADGIPEFVGAAFGEVAALLEKEHGDVAGPPFARYHRTPDGFDVEAGFPAAGPFTPEGRVEIDELPGGPTATVLYQGPYEKMAPTYGALLEWFSAHGSEPGGDPWESYLDGPDVPEPRTLISVPCRTD